MPPTLKEAVMRPLLKSLSLDLNELNNYYLLASIPFWGKVIEVMVATQLQDVLEEAD